VNSALLAEIGLTRDQVLRATAPYRPIIIPKPAVKQPAPKPRAARIPTRSQAELHRDAVAAVNAYKGGMAAWAALRKHNFSSQYIQALKLCAMDQRPTSATESSFARWYYDLPPYFCTEKEAEDLRKLMKSSGKSIEQIAEIARVPSSTLYGFAAKLSNRMKRETYQSILTILKK
jgi:hypothetical protein